jgi:hypothetical protein
MREGDSVEDVDVDRMVALKWIFKQEKIKTCTGFIWHRTAKSGEFL